MLRFRSLASLAWPGEEGAAITLYSALFIGPVGSFERGQDCFTTDDVIANFDFDFGLGRQINIHPRTELDQADPVATHYLVSLLNEGNNATGEDARDQPDANLAASGFSGLGPKQCVLVMDGGFGFERVVKLADRGLVEKHIGA